jgi:hypothetical protein
MDESEKSERSWWQTLPGILTAIAGIITAITGLIVALYQQGLLGPGPNGRAGKESPTSVYEPPQSPSPKKENEPPGKIPFRDDFKREQLGKMYEILNPDPNRLAVTKGGLLIVAAPIGEGQVPKNLVLLQQRFPDDFTATIRVTMQVTEENSVGLWYWVDSKNNLFLGVNGWKHRYYNYKGRDIVFTKILNKAQPNRIRPFFSPESEKIVGSLGDRQLQGYATKPEVWYFQLERKGLQYTGRVSIDGADWQEVGTHAILNKDGRLGFAAVSDGIENPAEFDNLEVKGPNEKN